VNDYTQYAGKPIFLTSCIKGFSRRDKKPGWIISFEYNELIIKHLKKAVHKNHHEWDRKAKTWWISELYEDVLDELFDNWYSLAKRQGTLF